jgi:hypothetical protein
VIVGRGRQLGGVAHSKQGMLGRTDRGLADGGMGFVRLQSCDYCPASPRRRTSLAAGKERGVDLAPHQILQEGGAEGEADSPVLPRR